MDQASSAMDVDAGRRKPSAGGLNLPVAGLLALRPPAYLPARTWLAMVTYLRPASCALATASVRLVHMRTLASLMSMGRLMPASTSTFGLLMHEMARLEGVPPNMSV